MDASSSSGPAQSVEYHFQPRASLLPLLHAARYPSSIIVGCLLGPPAQSTTTTRLEFEHAIPLLHHWTGLTFAIEAGMQMVQEFARTKGWTVLGFYYAMDTLHRQQQGSDVKDGNQPGKQQQGRSTTTPLAASSSGSSEGQQMPGVILRIVEASSSSKAKSSSSSQGDATSHPQPIIFQLDNTHLSEPQRAFVQVHPSTPAAASSPTTPSYTYASTPSTDASPARLQSLIASKQHRKLADWDDHLEDLGARWLSNEEVDLSLQDAEIEERVKHKQGQSGKSLEKVSE